MLSQFFILSPRGDTIILRDYLGNVPKGSSEVLFRKVKFWDGGGQDAPPVFHVDGVNYLYVKDGGVLLCATTRENVSPFVVLELLRRIGGIIKDYCGLLSEDAVRKNFVLVYELLDEVIDYGYPQNSSSEALKELVHNEPTIVKPPKHKASVFSVGKGPTGVIKSVLDTARTDGGRRDEIFVDIVERISCTFNSAGYIHASQIDGAIQVKSYLAGNPAICLALNDTLAIGRRGGAHGHDYSHGGGTSQDAVMLDDCNFHESVSLDRFDTERTLELVPPDGEFAVMNYRSTYDFKPPFRVNVVVEPDRNSSLKALVTIRLKADFLAEKAASGLELSIAFPKEAARMTCEYERETKPSGSQSWDWQERLHRLTWKLKRVQGGSDHALKARVTLDEEYSANFRRGVGPVNCTFAIPMYCASRLQVRYLQILKNDKNYSPYRWVRYVTMSSSYTFRT
ncbi:hypothetical protein WJX74_007199 [Apatococcus lobatus]|uniref:MHD domain-containing protein n=2 Tax=Apatococcus TaxID=904362 RepID=A0AAW1SP11_9CHLO